MDELKIEQAKQELMDYALHLSMKQTISASTLAIAIRALDAYSGEKWISVNDKLPEETDIHFHEGDTMRFTSVLVYDSVFGRKVANRFLIHNKANIPKIKKTKGYEWSTGRDITHWMPLLEPPKED